YPRRFLTQLVSSQLDMDRMDYLKRDSFFTGVVEGNINPDRIISTLNVKDDQLVVDSKGIYSVEKYLVARMLMYWQVYNHKSSFSAEVLVTQALRRAKELSEKGEDLFATEGFSFFLKTNINKSINECLEQFTLLDYSDILTSLKVWQYHDDKILYYLLSALLNRRLQVSKILNKEVSVAELEKMK